MNFFVTDLSHLWREYGDGVGGCLDGWLVDVLLDTT